MKTKINFDFQAHDTSLKKEILAGITSFFTIVYIAAVNASILADAGIPFEAGMIATVLTSVVGCLLIGFYANAPIILVPGMGVNAFFTYTMVESMGLSWEVALASVFVAGILFAITAFTPLSGVLSKAIPRSLKEAITVGIGLFLTFIGLQKGGIVVSSDSTFVALGNLGSAHVIATLATLALAAFLLIRNVKGHFLISMLAGTALAWSLGLIETGQQSSFSFSSYGSVFAAMSFDDILMLPFWIATFSMAMILVFENMGLLTGLLPDQRKFTKSYQANAISAISSGLFGTSPTVSTVESASGISAGGRTGLTAITTGLLFLTSLFFIPIFKIIPDSAIAPVLIIIGGLMITSIQNISLQDFSEGFPAFLIIVMIPLTYSIVDGIAFGFIAYPFLKIALGKGKEVPVPMYIIASLFFINFFLHTI
ncbi:NCS2 family permease [Bacillus sp. es.036]|uniref:NCS2 family permease n=1 Tax=Bacillus sp. es.036 TaxID=1761764 RepID=UPI000BF7347B|nr:NCS2 family permease [Bacillus sp. es.036]PFG12548.1 AGZA family xanthine/uracil permease-like MFS transporter [Bacillus sp. es.036]